MKIKLKNLHYEIYVRIIEKSRFEKNYLKKQASFKDYKIGKVKIKKGAKIRGGGPSGRAFITPKFEFDRIRNKTPRNIADILGIPYHSCVELVAMYLRVKKDEVYLPTKKDAGNNPYWEPGGRTKNIKTGQIKDGVEERVVDPLPATRIQNVDDLGHVD